MRLNSCHSLYATQGYLKQFLAVQEQIVLKEEAEAGSKAWNKLYYMPAQADRCTGNSSHLRNSTLLICS